MNEQLLKVEFVCVICTSEPLHAHDGYCASSGVDFTPSELLSVPLNVESRRSAENAPLSKINLPCVEASGDVCAGVIVRLVSEELESVNVNEEMLLVRERNTGCARSQWRSVHVSEDIERVEGMDEERDV